LSLSWTTTKLTANHAVGPEDFEPGLAIEDQPGYHELYLHLHDVRLTTALAIRENLEVGLVVPVKAVISDAAFLSADGALMPGFRSIHHRDETLSGVGDLRVVTRYRLSKPDADYIFDVRVGLSLPTGNTEPNPFVLGRAGLEHQHIFFGTGTFNPLVGLSAIVPVGPVVLDADFSAAGSLYRNEHDYRAPGLVNGRFGVSMSAGQWSADVSVAYLQEFPADWAGERAENSGRTDIIPGIGIRWRPSESWGVAVVGKRPITIDTVGGQLEFPYLATLALSYRGRAWEAPPEPSHNHH